VIHRKEYPIPADTCQRGEVIHRVPRSASGSSIILRSIDCELESCLIVGLIVSLRSDRKMRSHAGGMWTLDGEYVLM
jgi:hypothetical protein